MECHKGHPVKILLVHSGNESFVRLDRELLSRSFQVDDFYARWKFPSGMLRLWNGIRNVDVVYCWFASWNSFWAILLARLAGKRSILVIGGYDIANVPEANYGHQRGGAQKLFSRWSMHLADKLITFSNFSRREAEQNAGIPEDSIEMVYLGVPDPFGSLPKKRKERIALTVGRVDFSNLRRKGLQAFVQAAAFLPDVQFVLVGPWADASIEQLRAIATPNVTFTGWVTDAELLEYYRKAAVYVQASLHEGFGMSVAEAMLAGCIPMVTRVGSLPEVVGDCGLFCDTPEPASIARTIYAAITGHFDLRAQARDRILSHFPLARRGQSLKESISLTLNHKGMFEGDIE